MKTFKNSEGFSVLHASLVFVVIGFTGWYVWNAGNETTKETTKSNRTQSSSTHPPRDEQAPDLTKTYTDTTGELSVSYPSSWKLPKKHDATNPDNEWSDAKLTSPGGAVLSLRSDFGGRGGDCIPEDSDKPFAAGNACATEEYLSSEVLPINNVYYSDDEKAANGTIKNVYKKTEILLVTAHYADNDGKSQHTIGLADSNPRSPVSLNKPTMGFTLPEHSFAAIDAAGKFHRDVYVTASSKDEGFLGSKDAATIKAILRTLKVSI